MGKKKKQLKARKLRGEWGDISPVTQVIPNKKKYSRKKVKPYESDNS